MNTILKLNTYPFLIVKNPWRTFCSICLILCAFSPRLSQAHPHSWIDLKTEIEGNKTHVTGFNMSWTFDVMTSAYMIDGDYSTMVNKEKALQEMADGIMENLYVEHYFTYFYHGGEPVKFTRPTKGHFTQNEMKFTLHFYLPLSQPQLINEEPFELLVYESSYYVNMSWKQQQDVTLSPDMSDVCSLTLVEPQVTEEQIFYASAKPINAQPDPRLGSLFTQRAKVKCLAEKVQIDV